MSIYNRFDNIYTMSYVHNNGLSTLKFNRKFLTVLGPFRAINVNLRIYDHAYDSYFNGLTHGRVFIYGWLIHGPHFGLTCM